MNISEHFDHQSKKQNKEHFRNLIQVALADGKIEPKETEMLHKFGKKMSFTNQEIEALIASGSKDSFNPPYELNKRFIQVYEIVYMVLADGKIDEDEIHLAKRYALKSGFDESEIPIVINILINGIKLGKDEDDLFSIYRKLKSA
jgi:uncharacterized tellurite resistance protein B-like protein